MSWLLGAVSAMIIMSKGHARHRLARPRIIIGVASRMTEVEKKAVKQSAESAGAKFFTCPASAAALPPYHT